LRTWIRRLTAAQPDTAEDAPRGGGCGDPRRTPGPVGDDVPRKWIVQPVRVESLEALPPEELADDRYRVTFFVNIRDAADQRCPDLIVDARIAGPERTGEGSGHTDEYGQVRFRMTGPAGTYRCAITGIGAGGLEVSRAAGDALAAVTAEVT
jgi:hypothetical protein